jgi:hypothetical protein
VHCTRILRITLAITAAGLIACLGGAVGRTSTANAQAIPDLSGPWPIVVTPNAGPVNQCIAEIVQDGASLDGSKIRCEGLGMATLNGTVSAGGVVGFTTAFSFSGVTVEWDGSATSTSASGGYTTNLGGSGGWSTDRCGTADSDEDALLDCWEAGGIDFDNDGTDDLALGSNPLRKDLFVEADYMDCAAGGCPPGDTHSDRPLAGSISDVVLAFQQAPVSNPNGSSGIDLHVLVDEALPHSPFSSFPSDFEALKLGSPREPCGTAAGDGHFGTAAQRASPNCPNILAARVMVYRYTLFVHATGRSGLAELGGNDALVSVGDYTPAELIGLGGKRSVEAGTFMHEFGHNLGLDHGGFEPENCKPNYLSVMNYSYQFSALLPNRPLDYSRRALPPIPPTSGYLDEANLNENTGLSGGPSGWWVFFRVPDPGDPIGDADGDLNWDDDGDGNPGVAFAPADGSIDWNHNNLLEPSVVAELNDIPPGHCYEGGPPQRLDGSEDWHAIRYNFRDSGDFEEGVHTVPAELTSEEVLDMAIAVDFDGDGLVNLFDNCAGVVNPDQADADGDGEGDACESVAGVIEFLGAPPETSAEATRNGGTSPLMAVTVLSGLAGVVVAAAAIGWWLRKRLR